MFLLDRNEAGYGIVQHILTTTHLTLRRVIIVIKTVQD